MGKPLLPSGSVRSRAASESFGVTAGARLPPAGFHLVLAALPWFAIVLPRVNRLLARLGGALAAALLLTAAAVAQPADPPLDVLMRTTDDAMRGDSSESRITMRIKTERWQRELRLHVVSEGTETALVRIEAPAKERGTATLKVEQNIWNYLPKVDRTIKVPGSMMQAAWMGSHFTNDDLVHESRYSEDFECAYRERPADGSGSLAGALHPAARRSGRMGRDRRPVPGAGHAARPGRVLRRARPSGAHRSVTRTSVRWAAGRCRGGCG